MRKVVYLTVFLIILIAGIELLRKYNIARLPIPLLTKVEEKEKPSSYGNFLTASVAQKTGDFDSAIKFYEKALAQDPGNPDVLNKLYGLYIFKGKFESALLLARENIEADKESKKKTKDLSILPYLLVGLDEYKKGNNKEVIRVLEPLADPAIADNTHLDGVVSPLVLAWAYAIDEDYKNAFRIIDNITADYMLSVFSYNRAVINDLANGKEILVEGKDYPIEVKSQKLLSDIFFELGQYSLQGRNLEEAVVYFRIAIYVDPDSFKSKKYLAASFEALNRLSDAVKVYDTISEGSEEYKGFQFSKAVAYHNLEKDDESLLILNKLKEDPKFSYQVNFAIGGVYMAKKEYAEAVKFYEEAEKSIDKFTAEKWNLYFNLGVAYDKVGNEEKSEYNLKKAIQLDPENPEILNYLAYSWIIRNKNVNQARSMLEAAVIKSGGAPHILDSYGWALYNLGYFTESVPFLEQASLAIPYNAVINSHLGDVYWKLGRRKEAQYQWKKARDYFDSENSDEIKLEDIKKKISKGLQ